jgi:hypothetical protein
LPTVLNGGRPFGSKDRMFFSDVLNTIYKRTEEKGKNLISSHQDIPIVSLLYVKRSNGLILITKALLFLPAWRQKWQEWMPHCENLQQNFNIAENTMEKDKQSE